MTGLMRPAAIAGYLWLGIAGLLGLVILYVIAWAPIIALVYAVPIGLLGALGLGLIKRRGLGLPLASMILSTVLAVTALDGIVQDPSSPVGNIIAAVYCGAITVSSVLGVWSARVERPAMLDGIGRRALIAILIVGVYVGAVGFAVTVGPLRGCVPIAPRALPSGAAPAAGVEDVAAGAKQVVWGTGSDRVAQIVGLGFWEPSGDDDGPTFVDSVLVRGQPATVYRMSAAAGWDLGFSWSEDGCDRSVFPGTWHDTGAGRELCETLLRRISLVSIVVVAAMFVISTCALPGGITVEEGPATIVLIGRFGADSVDCPWLEADGNRTSLMLPSRLTVRIEPTELRDVGGDLVARAGDEIRVTGPDGIGGTICSPGVPFLVETVERVVP